MFKKSSSPVIRLRGVRHNNLKNFDLDLPLNRLIVVTGLSGSGKSSLAFDTLFAEGQRRYIETFSPYARQFFDRMDKPQVDSIAGIPPAIAIEQRNSVKSTRSTVGTMTEICDYMKLLWPHVSQLHCRQCGRLVRKDSPQQIWQTVTNANKPGAEILITFNLPISEKLSLDESLALINKQGYQRLVLDGEIQRLEDVLPRLREEKPASLTILQDRFKLSSGIRARFIEACEQAYHFGKGKLAITNLSLPSINDPLETATESSQSSKRVDTPSLFSEVRVSVIPQTNTKLSASIEDNLLEVTFSASELNDKLPAATTITAPPERPATPPLSSGVRASSLFTTNQTSFSNKLHCATCDLEYREASPALFSFNHPVGACPACKGFGRIITIDYNLALPDRSKTLAEGVVKPWKSGTGAESQDDMMKFCRTRKIPTDVPFNELPTKWQDWVINGDPDYGKDKQHEWPKAWYGIKGYFRWLESKAYKMHVRVLLSRYRSYTECPSCLGRRFQPETLLYKVTLSSSPGHRSQQLTLADFYLLPVRDALRFVEEFATKYQPKPADPLGLVLNEVRGRLGYLHEVGLGYLTLDRPTRSLSGGETERVNLTTCLGTRLVNTLFVLDEPSVGLHPRDTARLVRILEQLRNAGNTVVVVEHESSVMRAADQIIDIGPGHGASGGQVVFQGPYRDILRSKDSLTGKYLSGAAQIKIPTRRPVKKSSVEMLTLTHATQHNLRDLTVEIPLGRFVCLTGVSGSGKTTLARDLLLPLLNARLDVHNSKSTAADESAASDESQEDSETAVANAVPHSPEISNWQSLGRVVLVDQATLGKTPRSNPAVYIGAFDDIREVFAQSELARQRGLNASAFSFNSAQGQCERCRGAGFEKIEMQFLSDIFIRCPECHGRRYRPHILEIKLAAGDPESGAKIWSIADLLDVTVDEALAFLTTFKESRPAQRAAANVKLLQEVGLGYLRLGQPINTLSGGESQRLKLVRHLAEFTQASAADTKPTLFVFDEPTTGLHFDDVRVLMEVFQRLVTAGHSLLIIEHNLDVIKSADWIIDLGPNAGDEGGQIVAQGTPEQIAQCAASHTGQALKELLSHV